MKLLIFAHKPPPHHGQSYMVQLLLEALGGDAPPSGSIEWRHLDCRFSKGIEDIGQARWGKVWLAFKYSLQAIWWRFRHGLTHFYYVPAFPKRAPIYRDWIVLGLCRPFFPKVIFHWHAVGLGEWLDTEAKPWERWISRRIYARPDLSIILRPFNRSDADFVMSQRTEIVPNGIPDPCAQFETEVLPRRLERVAARKKLLAGESVDAPPAAGAEPRVFRVLFLSICYSGKGLFDTVEAVALANRQLKDPSLRIQLSVAGSFLVDAEKAQFETRIRQPDLNTGGPVVNYHGFVAGEEKARLFRESDCLCFPTRMAESFGLVLVEAMAYGLPLITTRWRNIPEMLPPGYPGVVEPQAPDQIAAKLVELLRADYDPALRKFFLENYTAARFGQRMREVLRSL